MPDDVRAVPGENVMVERAVIDDALDLADYEALYNRELVPIGFVNEEHKGIRHESIGWSINAASKQKEGAWAFLRFLLSEEYQREYGRMFSPLKEVFEEQLTAYATPNTYSVFIEALREEVTITQKYSLNRTSNAVSNSNYGDAVGAWEIDCLTEEQLQDIRDLVDRSYVNVFSWDETAYNIITEEVAYYYNGERSLDEVMDYIQNRMDLYMSEKE